MGLRAVEPAAHVFGALKAAEFLDAKVTDPE